jgi:hypothetical protein
MQPLTLRSHNVMIPIEEYEDFDTGPRSAVTVSDSSPPLRTLASEGLR